LQFKFMLNKNNMLTGILIGLIFPAIAWLVFNVLFKNLVLLNKPAIPYLIALGLNLFVIKLCYKKDADETGKGVMLSTFVCMMLMVIFKIQLS
jgi:hypothetical protein